MYITVSISKKLLHMYIYFCTLHRVRIRGPYLAMICWLQKAWHLIG